MGEKFDFIKAFNSQGQANLISDFNSFALELAKQFNF